MCELAVVKIGIKGAHDQTRRRSGARRHPGCGKARRHDGCRAISTPRGSSQGFATDLSLRQCGTIGAITAGKVIEVVGTTFGEEAWEDISRLVNKVRNEKYLF